MKKEVEESSGEDEEMRRVSVGKVKELVSREKEDLDEIILTKTRLEKGIQVEIIWITVSTAYMYLPSENWIGDWFTANFSFSIINVRFAILNMRFLT